MAFMQNVSKVAQRVLQDLEITSLPIDPILIAKAHGILVEKMPGNGNGGVSGMLIFANGRHAILYATHIRNVGFQRFSIAHELGHYFLDGHYEACSQVHGSNAGYKSDDRYEKEADDFASALLMPAPLFEQAIDNSPPGLECVKGLKEQFGVSVTAAAIQYAKRSSEIVAIVISSGKTISYAFMSASLKNYRGVERIKKHTPLPDTLTKSFNGNSANVSEAREDDDVADLSDWFGSDANGRLLEEVIGLGTYGLTLTVLTPFDADDFQEDNELLEHWTPNFRR